MILAVRDGTITGAAAKTVFEQMFASGMSARAAIKDLGLEAIGGTDEISTIVAAVIERHPKAVADFHAGKQEAVKFLVGQAMREAKGRADPNALSVEIAKQLAGKLGIPECMPFDDIEQYLRWRVENSGLSWSELQRDGVKMGAPKPIFVEDGLELEFDTPSHKVEFYSERARALGLPPLPDYTPPAAGSARFPLEFRQGRVLTAFHSFYDNGRALPMLTRAEPHAEVWIHPTDALSRGISEGGRVELVNQRGHFEAVARVTEDVLPGVLWARDGWPGLNTLTSGEACLGPEASDGLDPRIPGGQSAYEARVEVRPIRP